MARRPYDRGSATVELAIVFPLFLTLLFTGVQAAEWYDTRNLCLAAARHGVLVARTTNGNTAAGRSAALEFLDHAGGRAISDPQVSTDGSTGTVVRVQVTATVPTVLPIPGLRLRVSQSSQAAREVFTVDTGR